MGAHRTKRAPGRVRGASSRCVGMGWYLVHGTERAGSDLLLEREDLVDVVIVEEVVQVVGDRHRGGAVWRVGLLARSHTHTHVYTASSSRRDATTTLYARSQELRRLSRSSSPPRVRCNQREELRTHTHAPTRNRATTTAAVAAAVAVARAGERQTTSATRRQRPLCLLLCLRLCSTTALFDEQTTPISFRCSAPPLRPTLALCFGLCGFPLLGRQAP